MKVHKIITEDRAISVIEKFYHKDWMVTYLGKMFRDLKEGEKLEITKGLSLLKLGDKKYEIVKED